ncbi:hypothetical protein IAU59_002595 [Kwoniella sp. CBS 9459]
MPFLRSSTRPTAVQCFFCLSPSLLPPHPTNGANHYHGGSPKPQDRKGKARIAEVGTKWNWQCERCGCWNIRDARGEMISDLPAMHDSAYNERSFSLRATPSSSHLPSSSSSSSTFCHSCLANQTLIMNMLANYLPDDDDPTFPALYAELPSYLAKLHSRYPPVCPNCQPAVDEALRKSDHKAQVEAWGSALNRGARPGTLSSSGESSLRSTGGYRAASLMDVVIWRIRGTLWWCSLGLSFAQGILATTHPHYLVEQLNHEWLGRYLSPASLVLFHLLSISWIAWDPYWLRRVRSRDQAKVQGRGVWVRNMLLILLLRLATSVTAMLIADPETGKLSSTSRFGYRLGFGLEIALLLHAMMSIRISQPVAIQLVRPVSLTSSPAHPMSSHTASQDFSSPSHLSSLSIGQLGPSANVNNLKPERANPIFGQMSLSQQYGASTSERETAGEEPMDWEPSPSPARYNAAGYHNRPPGLLSPGDEDDIDFNISSMYPRQGKDDWDAFATNRQRMFPQHTEETGLENLLAGWGIGGGGGSGGAEGNGASALHVAKGGIMRQRNLLHRNNIIRLIGFAFVAARVIGAGAVVLSSDLANSGSDYLATANQVILLLETIITCIRLSILLQPVSPTPAPSSIPTPTNTISGLGIVIATLEIVLRVMALSTFSPVSAWLGREEGLGSTPQIRGIEWAIWGMADSVDVLLLS